MVKIRTEPCHRKGSATARTYSHRCAAVGIAREADASGLFHFRQNLPLNPLSVCTRNRIVFESAFGALSILTAWCDRYGNDGWDFALTNQVVQDRKQLS